LQNLKRTIGILIVLIILTMLFTQTQVTAQTTQDSFPTEVQSEYIIGSSIIISDNADFEALNFTGSGTQGDPYLITNLNISNTPFCIRISDTTAWFVIRDCYLESNSTSGASLNLNNVTNARVESTFIGGKMTGIYLYSITDCVVRRSIIRGLVVGILLQNSERCGVRDNLVHSCEVGIRIDRSEKCRINANTERGISVTRFASENLISSNVIAFNTPDSTRDQPEENNAEDNGVLNSWKMNNWSDFVFNQTYQVPGLADNIDENATGVFIPRHHIISGSSNLIFIVGSIGHLAQWNTSDILPVSFRINLNNQPLQEGWWDKSKYMYNASLLPIGVYNLTLTVYDGTGNGTMDSIYINVLEDIFSDIGTEYVILASGLSVVLVVVALYAIKRLRIS
jgi:parallel beta-helix repeat protein